MVPVVPGPGAKDDGPIGAGLILVIIILVIVVIVGFFKVFGKSIIKRMEARNAR